jgi:hypothetical protein
MYNTPRCATHPPGVGGVWLAVSPRRPTTDYHVAPLDGLLFLLSPCSRAVRCDRVDLTRVPARSDQEDELPEQPGSG